MGDLDRWLAEEKRQQSQPPGTQGYKRHFFSDEPQRQEPEEKPEEKKRPLHFFSDDKPYKHKKRKRHFFSDD